MNKKLKKVCLLFLSLVLIFTLSVPGHAVVTRASDYFAVTEAQAYALGKGKVRIEFDMGTTQIMDELGVMHIVIKEENSDGSFSSVKTYSRYNTSGFIDSNSTCHGGSVTYSGTQGKRYYAKVTFYARDENGSETLNQLTNTVTA